MQPTKKKLPKTLKYLLTFLTFLVLTALTIYCLPKISNIFDRIFGKEQGSTMLSLYIAVFSLEATIVIAVLIYYLEKKDIRKEEWYKTDNAKRILGVELSAAISHMVRQPRVYNPQQLNAGVFDICLTYLPDIQRIFDTEQLHHLMKILNLLKEISGIAIAEDSYTAAETMREQLSLVSKPWVFAVANSVYSDRLNQVVDYKRLLNMQTLALLGLLLDEKVNIINGADEIPNTLKSIDNMPLFEILPNGYIRIFDEQGQLVCDAELGESFSEDGRYVVKNGWAKLRNYIGEIKDEKFHGTGCRYDRFGRNKIEEGTWEDGELIQGTEYDVILEKNLDGDFEIYGEYWICENHGMMPIDEFERELYVADCRIVSGQREFDEDKLVAYLEFLKLRHPERIEYF